MDMKKLGGMLLAGGIGAVLIALAWWGFTFREYFEPVGVGNALTCLYSYSDLCRLGGGLAALADDTPSYTPTVFWVGAVCTGAGALVQGAARG